MLEKIWQFAILANFLSVATAYTGKLVFCLYVVYTSSLNEMCYTGRVLPPPTHTQQHLLWHSVYSNSFDYRSISVNKKSHSLVKRGLRVWKSWVEFCLCTVDIWENFNPVYLVK